MVAETETWLAGSMALSSECCWVDATAVVMVDTWVDERDGDWDRLMAPSKASMMAGSWGDDLAFGMD